MKEQELLRDAERVKAEREAENERSAFACVSYPLLSMSCKRIPNEQIQLDYV